MTHLLTYSLRLGPFVSNADFLSVFYFCSVSIFHVPVFTGIHFATFPLSQAYHLSPIFQKDMNSKDLLSRLARSIKRTVSGCRGQWRGRMLEGGKMHFSLTSAVQGSTTQSVGYAS
jgi:hypothetical protein